jgi:hypothetical protein
MGYAPSVKNKMKTRSRMRLEYLEKKLKKDRTVKKSISKKILIGILALWLSLAMGAINLDSKEISILHDNVWIRCLVVFIFSMLILDIEEETSSARIIASVILVIFYYVVGEI